jgi:phosphate acyltransferase
MMTNQPLTNPPATIALDAMGGDYAPSAIVAGAVLGARLHGVGIELIGHEAQINAELAKHNTQGLTITVVHTPDVVEMGEAPAVALRRKKNASIAVTAQRVKQGYAQAMVAAGSTGAAMTAALLHIGRLQGIDRPAIGVAMPTSGQTPCLLIDGGANADCPVELLEPFARLGQAFMQGVYSLASPRVGLLNIGTEAGKGNEFCKKAFALLSQAEGINFCGNVEGRNLFTEGCDVAVCDGFTGNVALKSAEGMATLFGKLLKRELMANPFNQLIGLLVKPLLKKAMRPLSHDEVGGALLLGIQGICIISHGGSSANAIQNAIGLAKKAIDGNVLEKMMAIGATSTPQ